ncbi:hypothetical protein SUGI_0030210 [Cryptomeria japonica]|nr:hypothetical protein SUGI_0030210 [Cryptomeria japonica]
MDFLVTVKTRTHSLAYPFFAIHCAIFRRSATASKGTMLNSHVLSDDEQLELDWLLPLSSPSEHVEPVMQSSVLGQEDGRADDYWSGSMGSLLDNRIL